MEFSGLEHIRNLPYTAIEIAEIIVILGLLFNTRHLAHKGINFDAKQTQSGYPSDTLVFGLKIYFRGVRPGVEALRMQPTGLSAAREAGERERRPEGR